jgi:uncharacterized RDD family membrane protein YckC
VWNPHRTHLVAPKEGACQTCQARPPARRALRPAAGSPATSSSLDGLILAVPSIIVVIAIGNGAGANLITTIIGIAYYVYFEGGPTGQTIGKKVLGIRVYDFRGGGGPIGYGRAFVRYLVRIVSAIPLFLGYFWMLWDKEKQCWHDKAAGDVVVPVDAYPVN